MNGNGEKAFNKNLSNSQTLGICLKISLKSISQIKCPFCFKVVVEQEILFECNYYRM